MDFSLQELGGVDHVALLMPEWQEDLVDGVSDHLMVRLSKRNARG